MANVFEAANFFIDSVDNMSLTKLHKMLYFAQGVHLARTGMPLFDNDIHAWPYGPVVPTVHNKFSPNKGGVRLLEEYISPSFTNTEESALVDVAVEYGLCSAATLSDITHQEGTPWTETTKNEIIPSNLIKEYFSAKKIVNSFKIDLSDAEVIGHRNAEGVLVLSAEESEGWEDDDEV